MAVLLEAAHFARIVEAMDDAVVVTDDGYRIVYVNPGFEAMYGLPADDVVGRDVTVLAQDLVTPEQVGDLRAAVDAGCQWRGVIAQRHADGTVFHVCVTAFRTLPDESGVVLNFCINRKLSGPNMEAARRCHFEEAIGAAGLSPRERQVLDLMVLGRSAQDIGTALGITPRTAKYHIANTLKKLGAESRLDLIRVLWLRR